MIASMDVFPDDEEKEKAYKAKWGYVFLGVAFVLGLEMGILFF